MAEQQPHDTTAEAMAKDMGEASHTVAEGGHAYAEPTAIGIDSANWVAIAMVVVIIVMLWKRVPSAIGKSLDGKIAQIRSELDEAATLRAEAEALKAEYEAKAKALGQERKELLKRAEREAEAIVAKASQDADALVERRGRMAEEKIAAEERQAIAALKASAADAASRAAAKLIAQNGDATTDRKLVDEAIGALGRR